VARGGIGQGYGAEAELGANGRAVNGCGGKRVAIEEGEGLRYEVRVGGEVCAKEGLALFWGIVQGESEGGFDLLVAIRSHV